MTIKYAGLGLAGEVRMTRLSFAWIALTLSAAVIACSSSSGSEPGETNAPEEDAGRGRRDAAPASQTKDGGGDVDDDGGGGVSARPDCKLTEPFGTLTAVPNGAQYTRPFISADELSIYWDRFNSSKDVSELVRATRAQTSEPFTNAQPLTSVNQTKSQFSPSMTADGLVLTFLASPAGGSGNEIRMAKRAMPSDDFAYPVAIPAFTATTNALSVRISPDGKTVFWSDIDNVYQRVRDANGDFGAPAIVAQGRQPVLSPDGLDLYFENNTGIMVAHRASAAAPLFGTPVAVPEISLPNSYPVAVTPNNCRIYFYYGGKGLYFASRPVQ